LKDEIPGSRERERDTYDFYPFILGLYIINIKNKYSDDNMRLV